jgi:hypothetical protein
MTRSHGDLVRREAVVAALEVVTALWTGGNDPKLLDGRKPRRVPVAARVGSRGGKEDATVGSVAALVRQAARKVDDDTVTLAYCCCCRLLLVHKNSAPSLSILIQNTYQFTLRL